MADVDIDPFEERGKTDEMTDETIPLIPGRGTDVVTHVSGEQETSLGEPVSELEF